MDGDISISSSLFTRCTMNNRRAEIRRSHSPNNNIHDKAIIRGRKMHDNAIPASRFSRHGNLRARDDLN